MSDDKKVIEQVSKRIDDLLKQGFRISVINKDTFYLYSTDKNLLLTLAMSRKGMDKPEYNMYLDGLGATKVLGLSEDFYADSYNFVDKKYNFESMLGQKIDKTPLTLNDMQKMWRDFGAEKSVVKEQDFLTELIGGLIRRKCPIDYYQRVFYCFEKPTSEKQNLDKKFDEINIENKLVEYKTARVNQWFLTGEQKTGRFIPMDKDARQIFDKVKIALQKQKQNVK